MFKPEKILVPTDFSDHEEEASALLAIKQAVAIASQFGSELILLHVMTEDMYRKPLYFLDDQKIEDLKKRALEHVEHELKDIVERYVNDSGVKVTIKTRVGVPYDEILKEEKESSVDLIAISSRGQSMLKEFFYGSTTERVVRRATCSVLVVRKVIDR